MPRKILKTIRAVCDAPKCLKPVREISPQDSVYDFHKLENLKRFDVLIDLIFHRPCLENMTTIDLWNLLVKYNKNATGS